MREAIIVARVAFAYRLAQARRFYGVLLEILSRPFTGGVNFGSAPTASPRGLKWRVR